MNTLDRISALQFRVLGIDEEVYNDGRQHDRLDAIAVAMGGGIVERQFTPYGVLKKGNQVGTRLRIIETRLELEDAIYGAPPAHETARYHHWLGAEG